jgi:hypothetical protein
MDRKIGEGHAGAMFRLGLKELRNALNPSRESVADQEIGLYGTETQGEIAKARGGPGQGPEQESADKKELSQAEDRSRQQGQEQNKDRDRGGMDR